jgi:hypothetical protein
VGVIRKRTLGRKVFDQKNILLTFIIIILTDHSSRNPARKSPSAQPIFRVLLTSKEGWLKATFPAFSKFQFIMPSKQRFTH